MHTYLSGVRDRADNKATRGVFILSSGLNDEFSCSLIFHSELMMPLNCNLVISRPLSHLSLIFLFYNSCRQFCWLRPLLGCDCVSHNSISVLLNAVQLYTNSSWQKTLSSWFNSIYDYSNQRFGGNGNFNSRTPHLISFGIDSMIFFLSSLMSHFLHSFCRRKKKQRIEFAIRCHFSIPLFFSPLLVGVTTNALQFTISSSHSKYLE